MENEPPALEEKPKRESNFGAQATIGVFVVIALAAMSFFTKSPQFGVGCAIAVPIAAIACVCFREARGFGVGLLIGIPLVGLALFGICIASLKNI